MTGDASTLKLRGTETLKKSPKLNAFQSMAGHFGEHV